MYSLAGNGNGTMDEVSVCVADVLIMQLSYLHRNGSE